MADPEDGVTVRENVVDDPFVFAVAVAARVAVWFPPVVPEELMVEPGTIDIVYAFDWVSAPGVHDPPEVQPVTVEELGPAMVIAVIG